MKETGNVIALFWRDASQIERGFLASVTNEKIFNTKKGNTASYLRSDSEYLSFGNGEIKICKQKN